ncbi:MAG: MOSC domain-containing protein [Nitrospinota bacterium]
MGIIEGIYLAPIGKEPMECAREAEALAGRGLRGDRYAEGAGTHSSADPGCQITLIAAEALDAVARESGIGLRPEHSRRNLVTRGVDLTRLVGRPFRAGGALLRGVRLNQPCLHLEGLVGAPGLKAALDGRSGLNAEVLEGGLIRQGDRVEEAVAGAATQAEGSAWDPGEA